MDKGQMRKERIEWLLMELRHEVERGIIEEEIEEQMGFEFVVPISRMIKDGVVICRFRTIPEPGWHRMYDEPRLKIIK